MTGWFAWGLGRLGYPMTFHACVIILREGDIAPNTVWFILDIRVIKYSINKMLGRHALGTGLRS